MPDDAPSTAIAAEIAAFFAGYVDAFAREDADGVCARWDPVGLFPSPTGNFAMERAPFRDHCATLMGFYRSQGVARPVGSLLSVSLLFPTVAQARMGYRMLGPDGALVAAWEHVYILRKTDDWRISAAIADDEMAAWARKGASLQGHGRAV
jgi:ketosteroid isomerase-like protein